MSLVQRMIGAATFNVATYEEVEADQNALGQAIAVAAISAVAAGIGALRSGLLMVLLGVALALVGWIAWAGIIYLVGTKMLPESQTNADLSQVLRTTGFAQAPGVLRVFSIIPFLGLFVSLAVWVWMLVCTVIAVRQALDYTSTGRAVVVCIIGWLIALVVNFAVGAVVGLGAAGAAAGAGAFGS